MEHVIQWNDVQLEDNGVIFDDYYHPLIDNPIIAPPEDGVPIIVLQEDGDLNIHDPDMWLDQLNGKNSCD